MLSAGIVQDTFAGEAGEGERGRRSGDHWRLLLPPTQDNPSQPLYNYCVYVRTFLIRLRMLVICDTNSIGTKREEFPAMITVPIDENEARVRGQ